MKFKIALGALVCWSWIGVGAEADDWRDFDWMKRVNQHGLSFYAINTEGSIPTSQFVSHHFISERIMPSKVAKVESCSIVLRNDWYHHLEVIFYTSHDSASEIFTFPYARDVNVPAALIPLAEGRQRFLSYGANIFGGTVTEYARGVWTLRNFARAEGKRTRHQDLSIVTDRYLKNVPSITLHQYFKTASGEVIASGNDTVVCHQPTVK